MRAQGRYHTGLPKVLFLLYPGLACLILDLAVSTSEVFVEYAVVCSPGFTILHRQTSACVGLTFPGTLHPCPVVQKPWENLHLRHLPLPVDDGTSVCLNTARTSLAADEAREGDIVVPPMDLCVGVSHPSSPMWVWPSSEWSSKVLTQV